MAKHTGKLTLSKLDSVQVARSWLELGILPVPLQSESKRPVSKKGWNTLRVTRETIPDFFEKGQNVGGLWGEPSGWLVDIDLDCPEAVAVAPYLLPETFVYGRRSVPRSHYIYRCEGIATTKFFEKEEGMILEIRSTGSQSVLPPSIHPDKERYEINHDVAFKAISRRQLTDACKAVSAAAMFVRYYPKDSGRHDYVHAITGALLWSGWTDEKVKPFLSAVLEAAAGLEDDRRQRERTVTNTIEHFRKGDKVAGWKFLSAWMPGPLIELLRKWIATPLEDSPLPDRIEPSPAYSFDPRLLEVPGLVGEIAKWSSQRSHKKQPLFDLAVGLMCTAIVATNKYVVEREDTPLQPYIMLIAPSGGGKDAVMSGIYTFLRRVGLHEYVFQNFQSYHSMLDKLSQAPNMACWLLDEAARHLKATRGVGPEQQVMTWLLKLYGKSNTSAPGVPGRHNAVPALDNPFFTVCAASQPDSLIESITSADVSVGLINRFILIDPGARPPEKNRERQSVFPSALEESVRRIRAIEAPSGENRFIQIRFEDSQTYALFEDLDEESTRKAYESGDGAIWTRANQNALILAGTVAVGIEPKRPMITEKIAKWAIKFSRWSCQRWSFHLDSGASRSMTEMRSKGVERFIIEARTYARRAPSDKQKKLLERGLMTKSMLTRLCRHLTSRDLEDIVKQLVAANLIGTNEEDGNIVYWSKKA